MRLWLGSIFQQAVQEAVSYFAGGVQKIKSFCIMIYDIIRRLRKIELGNGGLINDQHQ